MRIHLKCSCGAEATWENDNDTEVSTAHMTDLADRWHMDHAKCREAWQEDAEDRRLASEVLNDPKETYTKFEPAKECEHDWHRELVGPDPSGESVAVDTCRKCQRKEVGRDLA